MTQKKDYPPEVWGPQFWFFIHTLTLFYPEFPNDDIKKKHYNFIYNLPFFIPHEESASNFSKLLDDVPLKPYLDTRKHFINWAFIIHNKINKSLNKPQFDIQQFYRDLITLNPTAYRQLHRSPWSGLTHDDSRAPSMPQHSR